MDKENAIRKAKAALRRAVDDAATPSEREIALRQAKVLLAQAGADEVDVRASEIGESTARLDIQRRPPQWTASLVSSIARSFSCDAYLRSSAWGGAEVLFCGFAPMHELASFAFDQLYRQGKRARKAYYDSLNKRRKKKTRTVEANAYAEGWVRTVYQSVLAPMEGQNKRSTDDVEALFRYMKAKNLSDGSSGKSASSSDRYSDAVYRGMKDGRDATLRHGVGVGRSARVLEHHR